MTHPPKAPIAALKPKESVRMLPTLTPASMAACGLDEHARMARPCSEYFKNRCKPSTLNATVPSTQNTCGEIAAPSTRTDEISEPVKYGSERTFSSQMWSAAS